MASTSLSLAQTAAVVVDGEVVMKHDGRALSGVTLSPDGTRVTCAVRLDDKWSIIVNGKEGKWYSSIITPERKGVIFDSPDSFHYLAQEGNSIYLVEETIEEAIGL